VGGGGGSRVSTSITLPLKVHQYALVSLKHDNFDFYLYQKVFKTYKVWLAWMFWMQVWVSFFYNLRDVVDFDFFSNNKTIMRSKAC
jgi:hypothetical protein